MNSNRSNTEKLKINSPKSEINIFTNEEREKNTILIIDDEKQIHDEITLILSNLPLKIYSASSGFESLILLHNINPKIIFLDILMPQFSGFETINRIRKNKRFSYIPIVALTSFVMEENINIIMKNGFTDYLLKPIIKNKLLEKISHFLNENEKENTCC